MARKKQIGGKPPMYNFFLNPYEDIRFTTCPKCDGKTKQRKRVLVIHIEPGQIIALNKTCRYCPYCDLLIAHRDEIEGLLAAIFTARDPSIIGNDYLVLGTMDRSDWRKGVQEPKSMAQLISELHGFKEEWSFEITRGWGPAE